LRLPRGGSSPESQPASTAAPAADHTAHAGGKVFFKEPANGAMVKSPVHLVFGSDMFTIAPVPEGEVTTVRENTGPLSTWVSIPIVCRRLGDSEGEPWVHFGKGNDNIDMQLTPGPHKLVVQAGDDKSRDDDRALRNINVTVTE
jgi:hypothetical protein